MAVTQIEYSALSGVVASELRVLNGLVAWRGFSRSGVPRRTSAAVGKVFERRRREWWRYGLNARLQADCRDFELAVSQRRPEQIGMRHVGAVRSGLAS